LDKKTHREKNVPDEAKNHDITPIQTEEAVFFPDPRDSDDEGNFHKVSQKSVILIPQSREKNLWSLVAAVHIQ